MPFLVMLFLANLMLVVVRDIKEDFLVKIFDVEGGGYSSWVFAKLDSVVTLVILALFGLMIFVRSNFRALLLLLGLVIAGMLVMAYVSFRYEALSLDPLVWLFIQSLCLYVAYLSFQTIFFDRFIACFRIRGNVGFFIVLIDFIGYTGTVLVLTVKEFCSPDVEWLPFYNRLAGYVGIACTVLFAHRQRVLFPRRGMASLLQSPGGLCGHCLHGALCRCRRLPRAPLPPRASLPCRCSCPCRRHRLTSLFFITWGREYEKGYFDISLAFVSAPLPVLSVSDSIHYRITTAL